MLIVPQSQMTMLQSDHPPHTLCLPTVCFHPTGIDLLLKKARCSRRIEGQELNVYRHRETGWRALEGVESKREGSIWVRGDDGEGKIRPRACRIQENRQLQRICPILDRIQAKDGEGWKWWGCAAFESVSRKFWPWFAEIAETCRKRAKLESTSSVAAITGSSTNSNTRNSSISSPNTYASSPQRVPGPSSTPASVATSGRHSVSPIIQQLPSIARSYQQYDEPMPSTAGEDLHKLPKLQTTLPSVHGTQIQQQLSYARNQPSRTSSTASNFSHGSSSSIPIRRRSMMGEDSFPSAGSSMSLPSVSSFDEAGNRNLRLPPPNIPNQPMPSPSGGYFDRSPRPLPQSHIFNSVGSLQSSASGASPTSMISQGGALGSNINSTGMSLAVESGNPSGHNASHYSAPYNSNERYSSNSENPTNQGWLDATSTTRSLSLFPLSSHTHQASKGQIQSFSNSHSLFQLCRFSPVI